MNWHEQLTRVIEDSEKLMAVEWRGQNTHAIIRQIMVNQLVCLEILRTQYYPQNRSNNE